MEGFFNFVSLDKKVRYTLGRDERLKSRKIIDRLFKEGTSISVFPFRILYDLSAGELPSPDQNSPDKSARLKAGFTVSSRVFKKAVDRNRLKRLMRECWRLQKNELRQLQESNKTSLAVFFIYSGKQIPEYEWIYEKMNGAVKRLIKLAVEKS